MGPRMTTFGTVGFRVGSVAGMALFTALALSACVGAVDDGGNTTATAGGHDQSTAAGTPDGSLPCDVAQVFDQHCNACHSGSKPSGSVALTSHDNLVAPSPAHPAESVGQRSVVRMRDAAVMPPTGAIPESEIVIVESWVDAGMPTGSCTPVIQNQDPVCTSGTYWTQGTHESKDMEPGLQCVKCHDTPSGDEEAPHLAFGGTVYPTLHEPDLCNGKTDDTTTTVVVVDANGTEFPADVRAKGNFYLEQASIVFPIVAEVRNANGVAKMKDAVDDGDCNRCHTEAGDKDAPGRIIAP